MSKVKDYFRHKQELIGLFLVPIPILVYWVYWSLQPSYWFNADPATLYFIDSLSVFIGKSYVYVDHPGTPMQVIGSILLALVYPFFGGRDAFLQFFLSRPNAFFFMAHVFLLAANVFCAIIFYKTVARDLTRYKVFGAIAIALLFFPLHPHAYPSLTFWSHNSLNFPFGTLLLLWLYRELRGSDEISSPKLILLGLASGILSMAQMYFVAWVNGAIFTVMVYSFRRNKNIRQAFKSGMFVAAGGVAGIILMLIPIYKEIPRFMVWLTGIITHLGLYGSGAEGIYSFTLVTMSLEFWWTYIRPMMLLLFSSLIFLGVFAYWKRRTNKTVDAGTFSLVVGLLFHIGLLLLLMTKAALKLRYSLSMAAVLPVFVFLLIKLLESTPWQVNRFLPVFYAGILLFVVLSMIPQFEIINDRARQEEEFQIAKVQAVNRLAAEKNVEEEDIVVVYAYAVPLKCAGLLQATNWTGYFQQEMEQICPNQYAIWDSGIELNTAVPVREIDEIDWDVVIWPGNGTNLPDYLYSIGAVNIPNFWHVRRPTWFYIHSEVLK